MVGSLITAGTIAAGSLAGFLAGSVLVGLGFGAAFMGALRSLAAQLPPAHRAGVMSAFFVVAYTAISIPAIGAGVAAVHIGIARRPPGSAARSRSWPLPWRSSAGTSCRHGTDVETTTGAAGFPLPHPSMVHS